MIKAVTVQTTITDDMVLACNDIVCQLREKLELMSNSVGIIQCDPEYLEAGIMQSLHEALSFPLVGGTTVSIATSEELGNLVFSMMVMTSDDVEFVASYTEGLADDCAGAIERALSASVKVSDKPLKMAMVFPTVTDNDRLPGDIYVETVEKYCGVVPVFGTLSVNDALEKFERSMSVFGGQVFKREMSYVLFFGDITPRFLVAIVPPRSRVIDSPATITGLNGSAVSRINNISAVKYFESIGFAVDGKLAPGVYFVPLLVTETDDNGDSQTFVRAIVGFNDEGSAVCRGKIPLGAQISFGSLQSADILAATSHLVDRVNQEPDVQAALFFSCIVRQISIGADPLKELAIIKDSLRSGVPFVASYSGGEISPICSSLRGTCKNYFHNYSLIVCLL